MLVIRRTTAAIHRGSVYRKVLPAKAIPHGLSRRNGPRGRQILEVQVLVSLHLHVPREIERNLYVSADGRSTCEMWTSRQVQNISARPNAWSTPFPTPRYTKSQRLVNTSVQQLARISHDSRAEHPPPLLPTSPGRVGIDIAC